MSSLVSACKKLGILAWAGALPLVAFSQAKFGIEGGEYPIVGSLPGDQVWPAAALNGYGGFLVWQDNVTDGDGYGISARHINRSLSGSLGVFRINESALGDQVTPQVAVLNNGGAVFAWQSIVGAVNKVYARFLKPDGTFVAGDVSVSSAGNQQVTPVVAGLPDGSAIVVWASGGFDGDLLGVYARLFSADGTAKGPEFQVNQSIYYNQRTPAVATLANGNVIIGWISESRRGTSQNVDEDGVVDRTAGVELFNTDVFARIYKPNGDAVGGELKLNSGGIMCANPCISASSEGFLVAWSGRPARINVSSQLSDGWDVYARPFSIEGAAIAAETRLNTYTARDQFAPKASWLNGGHLVIWTSLEQDGSREGVVGRLVIPTGETYSREFRINTTTIGQQMHPVIASTGSRDFLTVWTSYVAGGGRFDLFAQRYSVSPTSTLGPPPAPYLSATSQSRLSVTWPELSGYTGVEYLVYLDQISSPVTVLVNRWEATGLQPGTSHTVRLAYKLADGSVSPASDAVVARTWGEDGNFDGLPDDWQGQAWGQDASQWPGRDDDSDKDGATNLQEFLAGTDPTNPNSVLRTRMVSTGQGWRLEWNTQPGFIYQVQTASDGVTWTNLGSARLAADQSDSIAVLGDTNVALYRIIRLR